VKKSFFELVILFFMLSSSVFAQDFSEVKLPKTMRSKPAVSFSLPFDESKDLTSPYYLPSTKVFVLDESNEALFVEKMKDMSRGLGIWVGQSEALKEIMKQYPDLFKECIYARDSFNTRFGPAILQIVYVFEKASKGKFLFKDIQKAVVEELKKIAKNDPEKKNLYPWLYGLKIPRNEAENLISIIKLRANFESDFEMLKPLLLFHPSAIENTMGMALVDYLARYDFDTHPKAKGMSGWVRFPAHWETKEGNGPNIVVRFISPRDGAMFFVQIRNLPEEIPANEDLMPILDDEEILRNFANHGKILEKRIVNLVGQKAIELQVSITTDTPLAKLYQRQIIYIVFYKKWMFGIYGGVGAMSEEACKTAMQSNLNLFKYLATMCGIKR